MGAADHCLEVRKRREADTLLVEMGSGKLL
jgi:hypothetical protein